ncbi:MAG: class I SAM-dependent methyltransferase [Thermoplasmata archaeon]|nr:MAG: class I SAM-dependent methyltransferase [Thermoplasmata archaeon]
MGKIAELTPEKIWRTVTNPWKIPARLSAPPSLSNTHAVLTLFPDLKESEAKTFRKEFKSDKKFFSELSKNMMEKRHQDAVWGGWYEFMFMVVRFSKPSIMFETGVFDGQSSAVILRALKKNGKGKLISIDLPAVDTIEESTHRMRDTTLPPKCQPGWVIPDYLRDRHELVLGDSKELLPKLFEKYPEIDIFFHDSLHTYEHQYFEYTAAWPHLKENGLLLSDDIFRSAALYKFCKEKNRNYVRIVSFGALRK